MKARQPDYLEDMLSYKLIKSFTCIYLALITGKAISWYISGYLYEISIISLIAYYLPYILGNVISGVMESMEYDEDMLYGRGNTPEYPLWLKRLNIFKGLMSLTYIILVIMS